ncbi:IclR family transcriptional regulator [Propionibacteriaceae bacterium ES.041]|nr:IclR family transcriptional regulator [Propionibacteriaceae bacterium ES.041]
MVTESTAKAHRTVSRVTDILETVAAAQPGGVRLHELTRALDAPRSSVFGLVKGLVATGYLLEEHGSYLLGPALSQLLEVQRPPSLTEAAHPALETLRDRFGETASLATAVGDSIVYIDSVESSEMIRYSAPRHTRRPLYPPSAGKVVLAHRSRRRQEAYLADRIDPDGLPAVLTELERVRANGFSINRGETLPDVSAAAAPVLVGGKLLGVISVAGPSTRMGPKLDEIAAAVREAATATVKRV